MDNPPNSQPREASDPAERNQSLEPGAPAPAAEAERRALEDEFAAALAVAAPEPQPNGPSEPVAPRSGTTLALLDLSLDLLGAGGYSSAREAELRSLEAGGHDPKNRGFTIQNVELTFAGVVDPYLRGDASVLLLIDPEGESAVELEEAYLTSLDLPFNLQLKAGQFFAAFGRLNATHPHAWDFVDQPVVSSRLLGGDGFRNPGAQISWLAPLPFFAELIASVHNAQGETAASFRSAPGELVAGRTLTERDVRSLADLVYLARVRSSFDLGDELTLAPGISVLLGPNASGADTRTEIYGADLYLKWRPLRTEQGWPYVAWQSELIYRRYDAAAVFDDDAQVEPARTLDDFGLYTQVVWGFARPWDVGVRYDHARGESQSFTTGGETYRTASDPLRDERQRYAAELTYYPSEFSKLRLQYNFDHSQFLPGHDAHSVFLQCEITLGAHAAHKF